jgi:hypothetical protein
LQIANLAAQITATTPIIPPAMQALQGLRRARTTLINGFCVYPIGTFSSKFNGLMQIALLPISGILYTLE